MNNGLSTPIGSWYHPDAKKPMFNTLYLCRVKISQGSNSAILHLDMKWDGENWKFPFNLGDSLTLKVVGWRTNRTSQLHLKH